jgi:hypothetical protein
LDAVILASRKRADSALCDPAAPFTNGCVPNGFLSILDFYHLDFYQCVLRDLGLPTALFGDLANRLLSVLHPID